MRRRTPVGPGKRPIERVTRDALRDASIEIRVKYRDSEVQALSAAPDGAACSVQSSDARRFLPVFVFRVRVGRILSVSVSASCRCRGGPPRVRSGVRRRLLVLIDVGAEPLACARGTAKGCWSRSSTRSQEVFEGCLGDVFVFVPGSVLVFVTSFPSSFP